MQFSPAAKANRWECNRGSTIEQADYGQNV